MTAIGMENSETWVVTHGGRRFRTTGEMARIFARQAKRVIDSGNAELVVLRHSGGIDRILVTDQRSFSVAREGGSASGEVGDRPPIW